MLVRSRVAALLPLLVAAGVAVGFNAAFLGPMARDPAHRLLSGAFHGGHLWCFDLAWGLLSGLDPWSLETQRLGFPSGASARCLALAPAFATAPARLLVDGLTAYNLCILLTPAVTVLFTMLLMRRVTELDRWSAAAVGGLYAVCPYVFGCFAGGQTCKAQVWVVPMTLWTLAGAVDGPRRPLWVLGAGLGGTILAFTEPTYATIVPLVAVPWVGILIGRPRWASLVGGGLGLAACAMGIWSASLYYLHPVPPGFEAVFEPAGPLTSAGIPLPSPMAQPGPTLIGPPDLQLEPGAPNHVTYLGLPLLVAMLLGSLPAWARGRRAQLLAWSALVVGLLVAMGERLVVDNQFVQVEGRPLVLPAWYLAKADYPLARSMMYYRGVVVAALGLAIGAVGLMSRWRWGALGAWLLVALSLADTYRVLKPIWPLRSRVLDTEFFETLAADPVPGAVIGLPLAGTTRSGGLTVLDAAFHRRPTNGLVRFTDRRMTHVASLQGWVQSALRLPAAEGSALLFSKGIRYVVAGEDMTEGEKMSLTLSLGRPEMLSGRVVWRVGP